MDPWDVPNARLPPSLYPTSYELYLHPDLSDTRAGGDTFAGRVAIAVTSEEPRADFYLHAKNLTVRSFIKQFRFEVIKHFSFPFVYQ